MSSIIFCHYNFTFYLERVFTRLMIRDILIKKELSIYSTDLTDAQWEVIKPLFAGMRIYKWSKRTLFNAVLYINRTGCQWRNDFPPYKTVFSFYSRAYKKGLWDEILVLLVDESRKQAGRNPSPTYGISQ